jgi:hypothetical protein
MTTTSIDIPAQLKAFPFIPPIVPSTGSTATAPVAGQSSIDQFTNQLQNFVGLIPSDISAITGIPAAPGQNSAVGNDKWKSFSFVDLSAIEKIATVLDHQLGQLNALVATLDKVLQIVSLFINGFSSFSKLIESGLNLVETTIDNFISEDLTVGVFLNALAPPAFLSKNPNDPDALQKSRGGFDGFITRLQGSLSNTRDKNRPTFKQADSVGGWVILLDNESLDEIWKGLNQLAGLFDFMQNMGILLSPPPPANFKGFCGFFQPTGSTEKKFGVQLEWDQNYTSSAFLISRTNIPGGTQQFVEYVPTTLLDNKQTGEPGLITISKDWIASIFAPARTPPLTKAQIEADAKTNGLNYAVGPAIPLPEKLETVYQDQSFNNGSPVLVKAGFSPTLQYIDTFFTVGSDNVPTIKDNNGNLIPISEMYYVIQSCDETGKALKGPFSKELVVTIKTCNDAYNTSDVIFHPNARYELLAAGVGGLNTWTSIQMSAMAPWIIELTDMLKGLISSIKGMVTSADDSFADFLNLIQAKVQTFVGIVNVITFMLKGLKSLVLTSSVSFLEIPPATGGMDVFVNRIKNAKLPAGQPPFSGPNGVSIGFVVVYGVSGFLPGGQAIVNNLFKAFHFIVSLFTKD